MKTAAEIATSSSHPTAVEPQEPTELSYEDAARIAADKGTSVDQVKQEWRRRQVPISPLAKALDIEAGLQAQCGRAGVKVADALALQGQWEALLRRRDGAVAKIKRGEEALQECAAMCLAGKDGWEVWTDFEQNSPGQFAVVFKGVADLLAYERIAQDLPPWIERRRADLVKLDKEIAAFAKANDIKVE